MIRVIDIETTGLDPAVDRIVEVAWADTGESESLGESLVNPGQDIPAQAKAIHHITEDDVKNCPSLEDVQGLYEGAPVYAAHNARFDRGFLGDMGAQWICTLKCSMALLPEAPSFSNQVLRYWLNLDDRIPANARQRLANLAPHRALYDAIITRALLDQLLALSSEEALIDISSKPVLLPVCTFGKHKDTPWSKVPKDYLRWLVRQDFDEDVLHTAKHHLGVL